MRLTPVVLLPALVVAQNQLPLVEQLQGWFNKAKSLMPTPAPQVPGTVVPPSRPATKSLPPKTVTAFTTENWQGTLAPAPDRPQDWLVYITGGNKTCFGQCAKSDEAWRASIDLFTVDRSSPNLGRLNCETQNILCSIWSAGPPSLWHIHVPSLQKGLEQKAETPIHIFPLNRTTVTPQDIYKVHSEKLWESSPKYESAFHPMDGWLAQYQLNIPLGYLIYGLSVIPSWLLMIGISFVSRTMMSRRAGRGPTDQPARPAAPAPAPAQ
ncbi:hypothetical protein FQN57_001328 [Myotisia sp. PD_48]|nr:hypothetical protein FQN57_001328 [Myotisia sp. PD_48]